ncbi:MAG TPA: hypothetical protein VMC61_05915 [Methanocella sp.]|nr:hypothetical protein [Methanocella sp.]
MNPLGDALGIIKKNWKLLAGLNAMYFCVVVIGAALALMSPSLHLSMFQLIGSETDLSFSSSLIYALLITFPSIILPIWGPIIGASKFFIWGVAYVAPIPGGATLGSLLPQYILMLLQGEAYIIAIFACVRQLTVALASADEGFRQALKEYIKAVFDSMKLLIIVALLLIAAALFQALMVRFLNGFL